MAAKLFSKRVLGSVLGLALLLSPVFAAKTKKFKKIKASANPPEYVEFSKPLDDRQQLHHAVDRLTFGARPGDYQKLEQVGLEKFIDAELNPEKVPENPLLLDHLKPFESLRMSIRDTYIHYPDHKLIVQVARGTGRLPDDPELRSIVVYLADRYLEKKNQAEGTGVAVPSTTLSGAPNVLSLNTPAETQKALADERAKQTADQNDEADLNLRMKLSDILTAAQIQTLDTGKPDEKRAVLAAVPSQKFTDFVWALPRQQRQQLVSLAPVELRRQMLLASNPQSVVANDLVEGKLLRAIYSDHQLEELLDDFWFNHFNVFMNKGGERYFVPTYERESIRPHIFGKFRDLLLATAKSPAMLFYLDNWQSVAPDLADKAPRRPNQKMKQGLNENYGRELLELHTLGVDGGYTQKDVIEVARCFTGWTISGQRKGDSFLFNDKVHDKGEKLVLGHVIKAGGGMDDGLKVIEILAHHPSTAHFISLKLAKRFVADNPPPSLVNRMAETFMQSDGDIRQVMRTMLTSPEFWSRGAYQAKVKTPFEMIVSAVRATNADVQSSFLLANEIQRLGEPLYRKIEPTGYSAANSEWISSAALLDRMNFALALAHNRVPGITVDTAQWQALSQRDPMDLARYILEQDPTSQTKLAIENALQNPELQKQLAANAKVGPPQVPSLVAGLVIGSPEFQRR